eukprot:XP_011664049.1 PREDICTED: uncharacterized protein LOC105438214 [Strongylocentrotus purpuratus]
MVVTRGASASSQSEIQEKSTSDSYSPTCQGQGENQRAAASLVAEVMDDLLANSTFLDKIQLIIKSMVKTVVDATYQRLMDYSEENRGSIHDLKVNMEEAEKDVKKLHKLVESQQEQLDTLKRTNKSLK